MWVGGRERCEHCCLAWSPGHYVHGKLLHRQCSQIFSSVDPLALATHIDQWC